MRNELVVQTLYGSADLMRSDCNLLLFEARAVALHALVEGAFLHVLHHQINVLAVVEETV